MSLFTQPSTSRSDADSDSAQERARARRIQFLRAGWLVAALIFVTLYLVNLPVAYVSRVNQPPQMLALLNQAGLSSQGLAVYELVISVVTAALYVALGALIFWKRPNSTFGLYVALLLVILGTMSGLYALAALGPGWNVLAIVLEFLFWLGILTLPFVFPDGRFVPRWSRWLVPVWAIFLFGAFYMVGFFPGLTLDVNDSSPLAVGLLLITLVGMVALVGSWGAAPLYRYRRITNPIQRQQIKWFAFAIAISGLGIVFFGVALPVLNPALLGPGITGLYYNLLTGAAANLFRLLLGTSIAIAILRYRLWEIDSIINRTLVYVPLTGILAAIFAVVSSGAQSALRVFTGEGANGIVISTLVIVAVFEPIKKALQEMVDRALKEPPDPTKQLKAYSVQVGEVMQVMDIEKSARRLLDETVTAFDAQGGKIIIGPAHSPRLTYARGDWAGNAALTFVLDYDNLPVGTLYLGPRRNGRLYSAQDKELLEKYLVPVEQAMVWAERAQAQEPETPE